MSSSMSGQWTPCPLPMIEKRLRCSGVALERRHDQTNGTVIVRPSVSSAAITSSVTRMVEIRGSLATMLTGGAPNPQSEIASLHWFNRGRHRALAAVDQIVPAEG